MLSRGAWIATLLAAAALAGACNGSKPPPRAPLVDSAPISEGDASGRLVRELELEVLSSYERAQLDETAASGVIDPTVGLTVFGVGQEISVGSAPTERWPVTSVAGAGVDVVSRRLELFLSGDRTIGWSYDDVSLRLPVCGRIASIPLRVAQIYVRDSERWTLVAEHAAYAQPMGRWLDAAKGPDGRVLPSAIENQSESLEAQEALGIAIASDGDRGVWDGSAGGLAVWPDPLHVLRAGATRTGPTLAQSLSATAVSIEGLRMGLGPGRNVAIASATLLAKLPRTVEGGTARSNEAPASIDIRVRGTFVVERVGEVWKVRFGMVSTPITTGALVGRTLGVAASLETGGRVKTSCR